MVNIVIFGATSAIASATAKIFAEKNANILLIARNEDKIGAVLSDLKTRGANSVDSIIFDLSISNEHQNLFNELKQKMPNYDIALIAYGSLGDQKEGEEHFDSFQKEFETNFMSVVSLLTFLANDLSKRKQGTIAVISSVAGDRGRQSNYIYGAAKGALTLVLQGLRNRLFADNVNILTIKPGFVDSPMTANVKKNSLFVQPDVVAKEIYLAIEKKKDVIYVPWFWKYIMMIIKLIPEFIFKRLKL